MLRPFWKPRAMQRQGQEPAPPSARGQKDLPWTAPNFLRLPIPVSLTSEFVLAPSPRHPFDQHRPHSQLARIAFTAKQARLRRDRISPKVVPFLPEPLAMSRPQMKTPAFAASAITNRSGEASGAGTFRGLLMRARRGRLKRAVRQVVFFIWSKEPVVLGCLSSNTDLS